MDWTRTESMMSEGDVNIFDPGCRLCRVVKLCLDDQGNRSSKSWDLETEQEWNDWLNEEHIKKDPSIVSSLVVVLGSAVADDQDPRLPDNPMALAYLPFARTVFVRILTELFIHQSLARTVSRNYAVTFSRDNLQMGTTPEPAIVYNMRTSAMWTGDMALSATHFPSRNLTTALLLGCSTRSDPKDPDDRSVLQRITNRLLRSSEDVFAHPMLLPGIVAELERTRVVGLLHRRKVELGRDISLLQTRGWEVLAAALAPPQTATSGNPLVGSGAAGILPTQQPLQPSQGPSSAAEPWLAVFDMRSGLSVWRDKVLTAMEKHVEELQKAILSQANQVGPSHQAACRRGLRILERLKAIHSDYDEMIGDCNMIVDSMTLATNLVLARDNMQISNQTVEISEQAQTDGSQMKSIGLLTMVFLPATFVATLFSTSFFKFETGQLWIYFAVFLPLTIIVLFFYVWLVILPVVRRWKKKHPDRNYFEMQNLLGYRDAENGG